jgi:hypothetical protein
MIDHSTVYIGLVALGMLGNLVWMIANLRIEGRITSRLTELKDWLEQRYVGTKEWEGFYAVYVSQHADLTRRVEALERR